MKRGRKVWVWNPKNRIELSRVNRAEETKMGRKSGKSGGKPHSNPELIKADS
jgi:hypothetical protein